MEELARQAGWAKTFGLPLELISAEEAQRLLPADVDRRRARRGLPADRRLHRPEPADLRARGGRAARRRRDPRPSTRVTGIAVERGRVTGVETDEGAIEAEVVVNAGGMFAPEIGAARRRQRPDRPDGARVPRHEAVAALPLDLPTMRDPRCLVYFRDGVGRPVMGGYERDPAPWSLDGIPADFNGRLLAEDWPRFEPMLENAVRARARRSPRWRSSRLINGPEAFTPDNEFILGETDVRGFLVAAGFCAHGIAGRRRDGPARRGVDRRRRAELDLWKMDIRRFGARVPHAASTRSRGRSRSTRPTTTSTTRATSARPGGRCAPRRRTSGCRSSARSSARSPAGSGRTGSSRTPRAGDEALAPARLGRAALVAGDRRRAPRDARGRRALRRDELREDRGRGRGAAAFLERLCDNEVARDVGAITYTQMLNARGGIECDFTVTRLADGPLPHRHRHRVRPARPRLDPPARAGGRLGRASRTSPRAAPASGSGGRRRARSSQPLTTDDLSNDAFPYMRAREIDGRAGPVPRAPRDLRRRARLGAVLPDGVRRCACGTRSGRPAASTASSPAATRRSTRCRLEKGYRVWGADITPDDTPVRGRARVRGQARQGRLHRPRGAARARRSPSGGSPASSSTTRAPSRSAPSRSGSTARSSAG